MRRHILSVAAALVLAASPALTQSDTEPPVLVGFDFNPKTVDVALGPQSACSIQASDVPSGVDWTTCRVRSPTQVSKMRNTPRTRTCDGRRTLGLAALALSLAVPAPILSFPAAAACVVDRLTDADPVGGGEGSGTAGDLRYCITHAQPGDQITFGVVGTIALTSALPTLTQDVSIEGPGAKSLTVDGVGGSVMAVAAGSTVVVSGLTITGGGGIGTNGGGIFNQGTLTLNHVAISGNSAGCLNCGLGTGGGIWNYVNAVLTVNSSTISGNSALGSSFYGPGRGGGIANDGTLTLINSTLSGNLSNWGYGGAIHNTGTLTLLHSTVSGNSASAGAGGIYNGATAYARNAIIAGNGSDFSGVLTSLGHNLIGNTAGGSGFAPTDILNVNPLLGPLQDNGGPTRTMALSPGSPAIDAGDDTGAPSFDQRGPGYARIDGDAVDIGAFEVQSTAAGGVDTLLLDRPGAVELTLSWGGSCRAGDTDYEIYEGTLGDFTSHVPLACSTGGATTKTFAPSEGGTYYLVVPHNGTLEGSYGTTSTGAERPQGALACLPQQIAECP